MSLKRIHSACALADMSIVDTNSKLKDVHRYTVCGPNKE